MSGSKRFDQIDDIFELIDKNILILESVFINSQLYAGDKTADGEDYTEFSIKQDAVNFHNNLKMIQSLNKDLSDDLGKFQFSDTASLDVLIAQQEQDDKDIDAEI